MKKQENKLGCRVVLFPQPYAGHETPMLNLGCALYSKGFSITVIQSRLTSIDPTWLPNFTLYYIEEAQAQSSCELGLSTSSLDPWESVRLLSARYAAPFRDSLSQVLEDSSRDQEPVACLISHPLWNFAGQVADEFSVPRLALRTGGLLAYVLYDSVPLLRQKGYFPLQESEQEAKVLEVPPVKVKDLPPEANHDEIAALVKETKSYRLGVICNTFEELEGSVLDQFGKSLPCTPIFPIGPLHKYSATDKGGKLNQEDSAIAWLNTQAPKSVLYVSFGTVAAISKDQFLEAAWGLGESKQPFLWAVRPKLINGLDTDDEAFPKDFLQTVSGRGYIVQWAPQQEVLAHPSVGGFWTHSGWNSTIESICEGVPMVCLPFFGDQKTNARYVSDVLRIGLLLEKGHIIRQEIKWAISRLMVEKEGEEMRERITSLKEKAETCLKEQGSSLKALDQLKNHILSLGCDERPTK